ncbi:hypothetical protein BCR34DRAFT_242684 [Clohesyomyces aquaticus]|uniref:Apple domain-containing protein n=1 Tax=Clohesyomyces aquaticus TaxID=1231657 RepID=A0A1Y1ZVF5_9PLEO|nr:hypothetical protein BCR34DRAFT_242684 [Clohesyomyces aquaticus]
MTTHNGNPSANPQMAELNSPSIVSPYSPVQHPNEQAQQWDPQNPRYWQSYPQAVRMEGEQDTSKVVYPETGARGQDEKEKPKGTKICGLSLLGFSLVAALIALTIAAAVGGGVGGGLAHQRAKRCREELKELRQSLSALPSPTPTPSSPTASISPATAQPSTITVPSTGCPGSNGTTYTATFGSESTSYTRICNIVKGGGDMFQVSTPSWESCMDACAQYGSFFAAQQTLGSFAPCVGVSYVPEWSVHPEYAYGNYSTRGSCWLKSNMDGLPGGWGLPTEVVSSVRR